MWEKIVAIQNIVCGGHILSTLFSFFFGAVALDDWTLTGIHSFINFAAAVAVAAYIYYMVTHERIHSHNFFDDNILALIRSNALTAMLR